MTDSTSLAKLATDELARPIDPPTPPSPEVRARALLAMTSAFRAQRAARLRRRVAIGAAGAVAAAAAVIVFASNRPQKGPIAPPAPATTVAVELKDHTGNVTLLHGEQPTTLGSSTPIGLDDRVHVGDGSASIQLSTGTHVSLESQTDVTFSIAAPNEVITLGAGAATFQVAKLSGGNRFLVRTGDAEVEVRGTKFRVAKVASDASCGGGTTTRVSVLEGVVVVRDGNGSSDVPAGSEWPKGCVAAATPTPTPSPVPMPVPMPMPTTSPAPTTTTTTATTASSSALAAQNDLFTRALREKKEGNVAAALVDLDALLSQYPGGPLAENAEVERMRLLHGPAAADAAKAYLAHHPQGWARAEAEAILAAAAP